MRPVGQQFAGKLTSARPVFRIVELIEAHRVMEESEAEDQIGIGFGNVADQLGSRPGNEPPVTDAMVPGVRSC
jgi:hypothetical protein